jgi:hypothetical protein
MNQEALFEKMEEVGKIKREMEALNKQIVDIEAKKRSLELKLASMFGAKRIGSFGRPKASEAKMFLSDAIAEALQNFPQGTSIKNLAKVVRNDYEGRIKRGAAIRTSIYHAVSIGKINKVGGLVFPIRASTPVEQVVDTRPEEKPVPTFFQQRAVGATTSVPIKFTFTK